MRRRARMRPRTATGRRGMRRRQGMYDRRMPQRHLRRTRPRPVDTDGTPERNAHADQHSHGKPDSYRQSNRNRESYGDIDPDGNTNSHLHAEPDRYTDRDRFEDAHRE